MTTRDRVAEAYDAYYDVMRYIAGKRFHVPPAEIRPLIHDVFVRFIRHEAEIADDRGWLVVAVINACRNYWRDREPTDTLPPTAAEMEGLTEDVNVRLDVARLLARIPKRCQKILWLRYVAGLSPEEIANQCAASASSGYGRQLIHRCLRAIREVVAQGLGSDHERTP